MIIKSIAIEKFRAFKENTSFELGRCITVISGRNATQKTTVLGMIGQPFTITKGNPMYGYKTIDGYNFRSQFNEKFKISPKHDIIGEHKWKLNLHNGIYDKNYFSIQSIQRIPKQGQKPTLRFWNSESRAKGAGYIQLPVYFLSLSRLFPIGETGKTKTIASDLTQDELNYCIQNYRTILSIKSVGENPSVGMEKGGIAKTFSGISDSEHDIFTNSAGESNIMKIILAVLSFKRLKEQFGGKYKGGILLIDEVDATLYGFSQKKLVDYLFNAAKENKIQIVFTTHSPIILRCIGKHHRKEIQKRGNNLPLYAYDSSIVYLKPDYDEKGKRTIMGQNISSSDELNTILNDINLTVPINGTKLNIYCEDKLAILFLQYVLSNTLNINLELFMNFIDINLGWTNYVQLAEKKVPEFRNNIIVLDGDVTKKREYRSKARVVEECGNFLFLPLVIEKNIFELLKDYSAFLRFQKMISKVLNFNYDICFNEWPLESDNYNTNDFKNWFNNTTKILGKDILFNFWCNENREKVEDFVENFIHTFNKLAEEMEVDTLPNILENEEDQEID